MQSTGHGGNFKTGLDMGYEQKQLVIIHNSFQIAAYTYIRALELIRSSVGDMI